MAEYILLYVFGILPRVINSFIRNDNCKKTLKIQHSRSSKTCGSPITQREPWNRIGKIIHVTQNHNMNISSFVCDWIRIGKILSSLLLTNEFYDLKLSLKQPLLTLCSCPRSIYSFLAEENKPDFTGKNDQAVEAMFIFTFLQI